MTVFDTPPPLPTEFDPLLAPNHAYFDVKRIFIMIILHTCTILEIIYA